MRVSKRLSSGVLLLSLILTGCGAKAANPQESQSPYPVLRIHVGDVSRMSQLPLIVAQKLGFFANLHLSVRTTSKAAPVTVSTPGTRWPLVGWVATRPDLMLMAPIPDPHFRLRALSGLPMPYASGVASEMVWAKAVLSHQRTRISAWHPMRFTEIEALWKRHHLPWVMVNLAEAQRLHSIDPKSVTLAWLGASTGPVPAVAVSAESEGPRVSRFLAALNLALWYLRTTPPGTVARSINQPGLSARAIRAALHYQYWPATTYPDAAAYNRARTLLEAAWPAYGKAAVLQDARQALKEFGK
ncbi:hypothetical protein [Sulfobacillus harzensis]|uniref:ABC transporter substrate-binding protein n=1 Tax=Sulfobacillus harzensis TaxID=2729629 RepID=A0A7Y0L0X6_9FIRM|nr:hypothetical protein [Sulfobacillus harzensis]NMP21252.1 hypothetical protein [Sulfobacillus harzensis]